MSDQVRSGVPRSPTTVRFILIVVACIILLATYLFQQFNFIQFFCSRSGFSDCSFLPGTVFIFNRTCRVIINDGACMLLVIAIFKERKYLRVSFYIFLFELLVLLPVYFMLKLTLEGDSEISSPLLSQIHRLIVNPMLMILVMIAFSYQRFITDKSKTHDI